MDGRKRQYITLEASERASGQAEWVAAAGNSCAALRCGADAAGDWQGTTMHGRWSLMSVGAAAPGRPARRAGY